MAVPVPAELSELLRRMERPSLPGLRWTAEEQWHMTVRFLADTDPGALVDALERSAHRRALPAAMADAGPRPQSLSGRVWVLPVDGLEGLADAVAAATSGVPGAGAGRPRRFRGHLTLARARDARTLAQLPAAEVKWRWEALEIVAYRSDLLPGGARHRQLGRWVLPPR